MRTYIVAMGLFGGKLQERDSKKRAIAEYNAGFAAKYSGEWEESLLRNRNAAELDPDDEASWWNMGIAATALRNWPEARRAWQAVGVTLTNSEGEVRIQEVWACVRLNPQGHGEVVWGKRIDPARIKVMNLPLPDSDRRFGDIILNDGAQEGTRTSRGQEYPVFNELAVWERSTYSTYSVEVKHVGDDAMKSLARLCEESGLAYENWGTIRNLCAECNRGNPGEHECNPSREMDGTLKLGFAARSERSVQELLDRWLDIEAGVHIGAIQKVVAGVDA